MSQLICPLIQFAVSELLALELHRDGCRGSLHLRLKQLMQRHVPRVGNPGVVPPDQNLLSFHCAQQWQLRHVLVGIANDAFQQNLEMSQHSLDAIGVK